MNFVKRHEVVDSVAAWVQSRAAEAGGIALDADSRLLEGGLIDSLGILELMAFLGETYGIEVSDEDFLPENFETIGSLASFVERKRADG